MYHADPFPPENVVKRDGRTVTFEADKISRALFAASESLGRPDAFLARELTDGIVHFLIAEGEEGSLTTARVAECVVKVVRELGQPALAEAFATCGERRPRPAVPATSVPDSGDVELRFPPGMTASAVLESCARSYTLQSVFARDIAAAHRDGLLTLTGLERPCELEACVTLPLAGANYSNLADATEAASHLAGRCIVIDGPEYDLVSSDEAESKQFVRELMFALRAADLTAVVNLNAAAPPQHASALAAGPLFAEQHSPPRQQLSARADSLAAELIATGRGRVRVDWHLGPVDFEVENRPRLERVAQAALESQSIAFTFDRPRRPIALAEGIDRANPAILLVVGLNLARLAEQSGADRKAFLSKLASLARLALSAAVQKRSFLRQSIPAVSAGFLLDRARLVVTALGFDDVVRKFTGNGLLAGGACSEFAKDILVNLRNVLRRDGRRALLDTCVDSRIVVPPADGSDRLGPVAAMMPTKSIPFADLLKAAGSLQAAADGGTLRLFLPPDRSVQAAEFADWLAIAWQRSELIRLIFERSGS
jgi:hypothetical protein